MSAEDLKGKLVGRPTLAMLSWWGKDAPDLEEMIADGQTEDAEPDWAGRFDDPTYEGWFPRRKARRGRHLRRGFAFLTVASG